jgi:surfeit locus 1 family protein
MKLPVIQIGNWAFSPGVISSVSTVLLLPLFVHLGLWQMSRCSEKLTLQKELVKKINAPVLPLIPAVIEKCQTEKGITGLHYSQWKITGQFLNSYQILVDNQILNGRVGYKVLTPFLPYLSSKLILIDRGWIPLVKNRSVLPIFKDIPGTITVEGMINSPTFGLQLKKYPLSGHVWPLKIQTIDFKALSAILPAKLYPFILQLAPGAPWGFKIPVPQNSTISATRHLGYAIQWFTLGLASLIYYFVINSQRFKNVSSPFKN